MAPDNFLKSKVHCKIQRDSSGSDWAYSSVKPSSRAWKYCNRCLLLWLKFHAPGLRNEIKIVSLFPASTDVIFTQSDRHDELRKLSFYGTDLLLKRVFWMHNTVLCPSLFHGPHASRHTVILPSLAISLCIWCLLSQVFSNHIFFLNVKPMTNIPKYKTANEIWFACKVKEWNCDQQLTSYKSVIQMHMQIMYGGNLFSHCYCWLLVNVNYSWFDGD